MQFDLGAPAHRTEVPLPRDRPVHLDRVRAVMAVSLDPRTTGTAHGASSLLVARPGGQ